MKTILVIEDNTEVRENVCEILDLSGYNILAAEHGTEGIEMAIKHKPDLVLCDVMMPRLDGYGVLKIMRANKLTNHIPFIFLTARVEKEDFRKGMGLGADDYITKPFDDTELLEAIETRLARQDKHEETYTDPSKAWHQEAKVQEWITELITNIEPRNYPSKDFIYQEGRLAKYLYYVASGSIKELGSADDGKQLITSIYSKGDFFGDSELIQNIERSTDCVAISECQLYLIDKAKFLHLLGSNRMISKYFLLIANKQLNIKKRQMVNQAYSSVRKKVANALLLFNRHENNNNTLSASRDDLAMLSGVAKETLIRTLSSFKSESLIVIENKEIIILDLRALQNLQQ